MNFTTNKYSFRRLEENEVKQLQPGDKITVCTLFNLPHEAKFTDAIVVSPAFFNSDADEPDWEIDTTIGYSDIYSIYEITEL